MGSISPAGHCLAGWDVRRVVAPPGVGFDGVGDQYFHDVSRGSIRLLDHDVAARVARRLPGFRRGVVDGVPDEGVAICRRRCRGCGPSFWPPCGGPIRWRRRWRQRGRSARRVVARLDWTNSSTRAYGILTSAILVLLLALQNLRCCCQSGWDGKMW